MDLDLTNDSFKELHETLDKTRQNSKFVKIPRQLLTYMLMDHSRMLAELHRQGVNCTNE